MSGPPGQGSPVPFAPMMGKSVKYTIPPESTLKMSFQLDGRWALVCNSSIDLVYLQGFVYAK